ncbi:hypothetical protein M569_13078, partial [Genlisea aurea]
PAMLAPTAPPAATGSHPSTVGDLELGPSPKLVLAVIDSLKKQVASDRFVYVKQRMQENGEKVLGVTENIFKLSVERRHCKTLSADRGIDLLAKRQKDAIDMHNGIGTSSHGDNESTSTQEDEYAPSAILLGSSIAVKNAVRPIKLPEVKKLPPYTTWIFLDRNQRMTEDQSVVGRRRIYYDQSGGEALICSDSEEEAVDDEEEKKEFAGSEDYILRMTLKEVGSSDTAFELVAECLSRKSSEIMGRYEELIKSENAICEANSGISECFVSPYIDKDLDAALDSFDNLFCRRCLVFDCRLHGCSQDLIFPAEKQSPWSCLDGGKEPCGPNCHRAAHVLDGATVASMLQNFEEKGTACNSTGEAHKRRHGAMPARKNTKSCQSDESASSSEVRAINDITPLKNSYAGKPNCDKRISKRIAENVLVAKKKRQKSITSSDIDFVADGDLDVQNSLNNASRETEDISAAKSAKSKGSRRFRNKESSNVKFDRSFLGETAPSGASNESDSSLPITCSSINTKKEGLPDRSMVRREIIDKKCWKPFEKALYEKGVQIFGHNSCLIARNLMSGLKSCLEIYKYMQHSEHKIGSEDEFIAADGSLRADGSEILGSGARRRSRFLRRKGRVRRLKYTWKSAGCQSFRKRISERKDQPCRQFNPCGCQSACGKTCLCLVNGTVCEKYCGCPKSCKNRFRGCHCAKSQCRSRQCPCFAADRECDPDVCRNCWISCGDGTLGMPFQRGDNYECRNMKLLLKQQQKVLLGRSDVSGWGAFLKNSVGKHEYLGEYTGELISHREADKRGKIYDRENSSFLFNLNDQFVLDAYRKGDKLKFANHSPDPNCYAKVILVAGDHRVGIFAKERIFAGEELFYDYRYEADRAPAWAKKPEAGGKRDEGAPSNGRAKKHT